MIPYSKPVNLAWQMAASEAASAQFQFIEIEHVFIGILRAGDVLDEEYRRHSEHSSSRQHCYRRYSG